MANSTNSKEPDYKLGDELQLLKGDKEIITAKIVAVYPTVIPSYKLDSQDISIPLYLSEPVLKKCLVNTSKETKTNE